MQEQWQTFRRDYWNPLVRQYKAAPSQFTAFKRANIYDKLDQYDRCRILFALTGLSLIGAHAASRSLITTLKFSLASFYGFGLVIYPELYEYELSQNWVDRLHPKNIKDKI